MKGETETSHDYDDNAVVYFGILPKAPFTSVFVWANVIAVGKHVAMQIPKQNIRQDDAKALGRRK